LVFSINTDGLGLLIHYTPTFIYAKM
jgi:hypothetical protein